MIHFIYSDVFSNNETCWGTPLLICLFMVENLIDFCNYKVGKMWPVFAHNSATASKSGRGREMILHKINPFSHSSLLLPGSWTLALAEVLLEFAEREPLLLPALQWAQRYLDSLPKEGDCWKGAPAPQGWGWCLLAQVLLFAGSSHLTWVVLAPERGEAWARGCGCRDEPAAEALLGEEGQKERW